jgi:DNA-binding response OmpR family regulator
VTLSKGRERIWISAIGNPTSIPTGLAHAIGGARWGWREATDIDLFLAGPRYPRDIVIVLIGTFTLASLDLIGMLTERLDLPVIVYALESHPMIVHAALEAGADDFIVASTSLEEFIARLRAVIRIRFQDTKRDGGPLPFHVDEGARTLSLPSGETVSLTLPEYHVFKALLAAGDQPVPRSRLVTTLAPFSRSSSSRLLDVTAAGLRRKVGAAHLRTVRGVGYQLVNGIDP